MTFGAGICLRSLERSSARVATPLGSMALETISDGELLTATEALVGEGGIELRRYEHPHAAVELLLLSFPPRLPEGMRVDECVAAVWRTVAKEDGTALTFRAAWEPGARIEDGGERDDGESLVSLAWEGPSVRLSLGTSDEDMLCATAAKGELLPTRLAATYDVLVPRLVEHEAFANFAAYLPQTVGERDGLEVELPPLALGETAQIHFVMAWRTGEFHWQNASTWFAVDVSPWDIARMADEALGRTA